MSFGCRFSGGYVSLCLSSVGANTAEDTAKNCHQKRETQDLRCKVL
jgi:hypothetical protein